MRFASGFGSKKIRVWPFEGPILIKEDGDRHESHLVDRWCYLGSIKNEGDSIDDALSEYRFDYDTYKILNRFIMSPRNERKIKVLSADFKKSKI